MQGNYHQHGPFNVLSSENPGVSAFCASYPIQPYELMLEVKYFNSNTRKGKYIIEKNLP